MDIVVNKPVDVGNGRVSDYGTLGGIDAALLVRTDTDEFGKVMTTSYYYVWMIRTYYINSSGVAGSVEQLLAAAQQAEFCPLPVTPLTPIAPGVNLNLQYDPAVAADFHQDPSGTGSEVQLLGTTLGVGAFGRVVLGSYRGERVAVKILNMGLCHVPAVDVPDQKHKQEGSAEPAQPSAGAAGAALFDSPLQGSATAATDGLPLAAVATDPAPMLPSGCAYGDMISSDSIVPAAAGWGRAAGRQHAVQNGQLVASQKTKATGTGTVAARTLGQEVEVLARCRHPNVIRLLAASLNGPRACLVMELMESSLERMLYGGKEPRVLPLPTVLHIAIQVVQALAYLHPTILHRDLKPGNILVSQLENTKPVVKLADIYAFGVILWEMLSGFKPWKGVNLVQVAFAINLRKERLPMDRLTPARCPPKLRGIIEACWDEDPARRPAAAELVKELLLLQEVRASVHLR
ncbi:hypothetical protein GPECTOR_12g384 [Gonium pectorale]|uniref:Protein kinase domain-containing protein n=1 Tax=Gonium pectorale TaxID=33097 RepID=A0A150GNV5_GONPE|nr:hypothetical protein GPECTOR_12g384 [Gonium pectorale]|eukprot:KXZ51422.1 hypothetical protein GPECTOR_12g384 [Gonium pectorale]